jgi:aspartyl-tRNA(Asn)/glutamyl-tRNA(Gln) amidotransferase subunit B
VDAFVKKLQRIVRYLGISGADMEKGSMRLEPSISLSEDGTIPKYRVELKNINSFRFARKALEYEIDRQQHEEHMQETRGWNEAKNVTVAQRQKEEAHDYRYFPEPDIPPMLWGKSQIASLKSQIGEMPEEKKERFMKQYGLTTYDANLLVETKERAEFFESVVSFGSPKTIANIMINKKARTKEEVMRYLQTPVGVSEDELAKVIKQVLGDNPKAVADYKSGKEPVLMFLVGQAMKMTQGKAAADIIKRKLLELLKK